MMLLIIYLDDKIILLFTCCAIGNRQYQRAQSQRPLVLWKGGSPMPHRGIALPPLPLVFLFVCPPDPPMSFCSLVTEGAASASASSNIEPIILRCSSKSRASTGPFQINFSPRPRQHLTCFALSRSSTKHVKSSPPDPVTKIN